MLFTMLHPGGHFVDGVEYVDSADELPHADLEDMFSFIDQELGAEEAYDQFAMIDADSEFESELDAEDANALDTEYTSEEYEQALAFIAADQQANRSFKKSLKKLGKKLKKKIKKSIAKGKSNIARAFVKMGRKGFKKLPKKVQELIRKMVLDGKPKKNKKQPKAKKPAAKKKPKQKLPKAKPFVPPMDPFAAKHYKKGFVPGTLGRPKLLPFEPPKGHNDLRLVEDCMSCRFIWQSVEMDVGNTNAQKVVYDSFMTQCRRGMGAPIMYQPCQMMFAHLDDMVTGYTSGLSVNEICAQARLCR